MEKLIHTEEELQAEAKRFVETLTPTNTAALITLSGELGAGKTAFVKEVAKTLGVEDVVNSPTFVLEKIYALPESKAFARLVHIDAYRLEKGNDLATLGFDELIRDPRNLIFLEWPEKVADTLPQPHTQIHFVTKANGSRTISYA